MGTHFALVAGRRSGEAIWALVNWTGLDGPHGACKDFVDLLLYMALNPRSIFLRRRWCAGGVGRIEATQMIYFSHRNFPELRSCVRADRDRIWLSSFPRSPMLARA